MKNKKNWLGMLVLVLAFGMSVFGCDNGSTSNENNFEGLDTWSVISSFSQLHGMWKSSLTQTSTMKEAFESDWDTEMEDILGSNMKVTVNGQYIYI